MLSPRTGICLWLGSFRDRARMTKTKSRWITLCPWSPSCPWCNHSCILHFTEVCVKGIFFGLLRSLKYLFEKTKSLSFTDVSNQFHSYHLFSFYVAAWMCRTINHWTKPKIHDMDLVYNVIVNWILRHSFLYICYTLFKWLHMQSLSNWPG